MTNGQPMADMDNTGTWTDYIYANGQKIAKVASQVPLFHLSGLRDSSINMGWGVEGPILGGYGAGTVIAAGDQLAYDFRQTIPSYGGLALIFDNGTVGAGDLVDTATGTPTWNDGTADGLWQHRAAKLDEYVGHSLTYAYAGLHNTMPAGWFDMYYANIVILHGDGSVTPIYTGQSGVSVPGFLGWNGGCRNCYSGTDLTPTTDLAVNANYYLNDHLGTTQMELSAGGWPLWQGQFTPFGQEIINGQTNNLIGQQPADGTSMRFKFTGKERDTESGLDYFGARYYASSMGRWMSPDPGKLNMKHLLNPQKWNKYNYVLNNPLSLVDPDGLEEMWIQFRAYIPQPTVGRVRGDNRGPSTQENASSRASITMHIETDPAKNHGNPLLGFTQSVSDTHNTKGEATPPQLMQAPTASATQDSVTGQVTLNVKMDVASGDAGILQGLSIRSNVNIGVNEAGTQATVQGTVSGSPAFEANFAPQGGPTTNLPIQGASPNPVEFIVRLGGTNQVDKKTDIKQPGQPQ